MMEGGVGGNEAEKGGWRGGRQRGRLVGLKGVCEWDGVGLQTSAGIQGLTCKIRG